MGMKKNNSFSRGNTMAIKLSTGLKNEMMKSGGKSLADALANGVMHIYSGSIPADADQTESGSVLLAVITESGGDFTGGVATNGINFDVAVGGVVSKATGETWRDDSANATNTAGWFAIYANDYTTGASTTAIRLFGTISTSGADMNMTTTSVSAGAPLTIDNGSLTLP